MARRALGPATLAVAQAAEAALGPEDRSLLVACSGGADSLALAAGTAHVARRSGRAYAAVVVDHGLQDGSAEVAQAAAEVLEGLGLAVSVVAVDVTDAGRAPKPRPARPGTRRCDARRPPATRPSCWATPATTRRSPCCSGWPAGPGLVR